MTLAILVGILAVALAVLMHYEILLLTTRILRERQSDDRIRMMLCMSGVIGSHLVTITLYALLYALLHHSGSMGGLSGSFDGSARDYLYFSIMSFTTLGVGDVEATGDLRIVAGLQALLGFVMIGWSASFSYVALRRTWQGTDDQ